MKKIYLLLILSLYLFSCGNEEGKIEMIAPEQVVEAVNTEKNLQLIDVRSNAEYAVSHLKDAQNICVTNDDFKEKVATLDKDKPVYVYCKKGGRSAQAALILKEMGFKEVYDLQGGLENWELQGMETVN